MTITDKIDNITNIPPEYRNTICPAPKSVKIELTGRCNLACSFCAKSKRLRSVSDMPFEFYERIVLEMRNEGVQELGLFYLGESLLYPHLIDAVIYAKQVCKYPYVFLTTNGTIAYSDKIEKLISNGLNSLKFSLNYADEKQFNHITRANSKLFHRVIDNIRGAKLVRDKVYLETGHKCGLYASYIAYDGKQGERMQRLLDQVKHNVDEIYALPLYSQANLVTDTGYKPVAGNLGRLDNLREPLPCWSLFTEGHITYDGKLVGCCFSHTPDFDFGDLNKQTFMEAWNSKQAQNLRQANLNKDVTGTPCEKCVAW